MSLLLAAVVGLLVGVSLVLVVLSWRPRGSAVGTAPESGAPVDPPLCGRLLDLIDPAVIVLDVEDAVVLANAAARSLGIVRGARLTVPGLLAVARTTRHGGGCRADVGLPGDRAGIGPQLVGVHGLRLAAGTAEPGEVGLVLQDVTEARRLEAVRRDFVANVGHELKTPVGALALLAEAIEGAADEPETVRRFAARMANEAARLGRLVGELLDLSRLQGADPLPTPVPVDVDAVLAEAVDRTRTNAAARAIAIAVGPPSGVAVRGVEAQLVTAVTNLLANAVAYSPEGARVAVAARARSGFAEVTVTDRGMGIPLAERARIFERFYRVDQSRSSSTGGTGLGLAIVKHVAGNHGGSMSVWSEQGVGSTFTLRIPLPGGGSAARPRPPTPFPAPAAAARGR